MAWRGTLFALEVEPEEKPGRDMEGLIGNVVLGKASGENVLRRD